MNTPFPVYLFAAHLFAFKFPRCNGGIGDASKSMSVRSEREQSNNWDNYGPSLNVVAVAMVTNSRIKMALRFKRSLLSIRVRDMVIRDYARSAH